MSEEPMFPPGTRGTAQGEKKPAVLRAEAEIIMKYIILGISGSLIFALSMFFMFAGDLKTNERIDNLAKYIIPFTTLAIGVVAGRKL
jgi:hypothetical protein